MKIEEKLWRTLIRVERYDSKNIYVVIPGYNVNEEITIPKSIIPEDVLVVIETEIDEEEIYRFHVQCNIGAKSKEDLIFAPPWECE
ncbi:MAG: hypothetical protein WC119_00200 [Synergistaceae bacterium]